MDDVIFVDNFGPQGPYPLREPFYHEVELFYAEAKKTNAHEAMGVLIGKITGKAPASLDNLPLRVVRRGQAFLLHFINYEAKGSDAAEIEIPLDKQITSLNGQEAWESVPLREPSFAEFKAYYAELEAKDAATALLSLMSALSGVNRQALRKLPITKFREAEKYLVGFCATSRTRRMGRPHSGNHLLLAV